MSILGNGLQRILDSAQILGSAVPAPNPKRDDGGEFNMVSVPVQEEHIHADRFWETSGECRQGALPDHGPFLVDWVTGLGRHGVSGVLRCGCAIHAYSRWNWRYSVQNSQTTFSLRCRKTVMRQCSEGCEILVAGMATAFAARDLLGNLLSGLGIQFSRPFSEGDYITVSYSFVWNNLWCQCYRSTLNC